MAVPWSPGNEAYVNVSIQDAFFQLFNDGTIKM